MSMLLFFILIELEQDRADLYDEAARAGIALFEDGVSSIDVLNLLCSMAFSGVRLHD